MITNKQGRDEIAAWLTIRNSRIVAINQPVATEFQPRPDYFAEAPDFQSATDAPVHIRVRCGARQ